MANDYRVYISSFLSSLVEVNVYFNNYVTFAVNIFFLTSHIRIIAGMLFHILENK